jgi:hypothetical protein
MDHFDLAVSAIGESDLKHRVPGNGNRGYVFVVDLHREGSIWISVSSFRGVASSLPARPGGPRR